MAKLALTATLRTRRTVELAVLFASALQLTVAAAAAVAVAAAATGQCLNSEWRATVIACHDRHDSQEDIESCVGSMPAPQCDRGESKQLAPQFSVISRGDCLLPAQIEHGEQPAWATPSEAAVGCDPMEGCLAFACKPDGCFRLAQLDRDAYEQSSYVWSYSDGLLSIHCEADSEGWRLYRVATLEEEWDGRRLNESNAEDLAAELRSWPETIRSKPHLPDDLLETWLEDMARDGVAMVPTQLFSDAEVDLINSQIDRYFYAVQNETGWMFFLFSDAIWPSCKALPKTEAQSTLSLGTPGRLVERAGIGLMEPKGPGFERSCPESCRIKALINKGIVFESIPMHPLLIQLAEAYLGSAVKFYDMSFASLGPGDAHGDWHPDGTDQHKFERSGYRRVKFFIWLNDFTRENGATGFVRGSAAHTNKLSYTFNRMKKAAASAHESRVKFGSEAQPEPPWPWKEDIVYPTGQRGWGLMYDHFTIHANGANRSPAPRRLIGLAYVQAGYTDAAWGMLPKPLVSGEVLSRQSTAFIRLTQDFFATGEF